MNEWWIGLTSLQRVAFVIGTATLLFMIVQIIMMLVGIGEHAFDTEADPSLDADGCFDGEACGAEHGVFDVHPHESGNPDCETGLPVKASGAEFVQAVGGRLLSLRCIIVFFCFGAWATFAFDGILSELLAALCGVGVGFFAAVVMSVIMTELMRLQRDGTVRMKNCVGKLGEVYLTVPAKRGGVGKVNILVQESLREFDAITDDEDPISTGEAVRILGIDESSLVVERENEVNRQSA